MTDRILHAQPEAMARFNYEVPAKLEQIIRKCLEKDTERRYQSAREVRADSSKLEEEGAERSGDGRQKPGQPAGTSFPAGALAIGWLEVSFWLASGCSSLFGHALYTRRES